MDVIIPLLNSSRDNYLELRYAIRSFQRWLNPDRVIIVGGKPSWFKGVHLQHEDYIAVFKERNIFDKLKLGAQHTTGDFYFCNDDHFLMAPYQGLHHKGYMYETKATKPLSGSYWQTLNNTQAALVGKSTLDYDTHYPILMNKDVLNSIDADWKVQYGYGVKTLYAYHQKERGEKHPDHKYNHIPSEIHSPYFSTSDICDNKAVMLPRLFPIKSNFEK